MTKLYITGGNGYIGRHLVLSLLNDSFNLKLLIHGLSDTNMFNSNNVEYVDGDLRNKKLLIDSVAGTDVVIHLGALVGSYNVDDNMEINYEGTKNLIEACKIHGIERFIFISTVSAKRKAQGPYGRSKKLAEDEVIRSGLAFTILRPTTVMGTESLGLNRIIQNVNRFPWIIPMAGTGKCTRHPVYINDFVQAIITALKKVDSIGKLYEIGGERVIPFRDLVKLINTKLGNSRKLIIPVPMKLIKIVAFFFERIYRAPPFTSEHVNSLTEDTQMDTSLAIRDLSFNPIPLEEMLDVIIEEITGGSSN